MSVAQCLCEHLDVDCTGSFGFITDQFLLDSFGENNGTFILLLFVTGLCIILLLK